MSVQDKPTSFDIAALAGVSQPTVSRALRGDRTVSEATRKRIEAIARQLNYTVDKNASSLRRGQSKTLALLFFEDPRLVAAAKPAQQVGAHGRQQIVAMEPAARRQGVIGDPVDEIAQFLPKPRYVEFLADILQAVVQPRVGIGVFRPHHADHVARAERHGDDIAGLQIDATGHPIGIGRRQ
eukprot:gene5834-biopygen4934